MTITTRKLADDYAREHSTGNSYYDGLIREAYCQGANRALAAIQHHMDAVQPPFYQRRMSDYINEKSK